MASLDWVCPSDRQTRHLAAVAILAAMGFLNPVSAHDSKTPVHFVSEQGIDQGDCSMPELPCATIDYALRKAGKGDEIRIAAGVYNFRSDDPEEIGSLLSPVMTIHGGFAVEDKFAFRDETVNQTVLVTSNTRHAVRLRTNGIVVRSETHLAQVQPDQEPEQPVRPKLRLNRDRKGIVIAESIATKRLAVAEPLVATPTTATPCGHRINGMAGPYPCRNINFIANIPPHEFTGAPESANDIWGFVDLTNNREYAIIGLENGTAVVDVTNPDNPIKVGATIPGPLTSWRDIKVVQLHNVTANRWHAFAYVTADAPDPWDGSDVAPGLQIIDLSDLPNSVRLAGTWNEICWAHNVHISNVDHATGVPFSGMEPFVYLAGATRRHADGCENAITCAATPGCGALVGLEISAPTTPTEVLRIPEGTGYIHDGTSLVIDDARTVACKSGNAPVRGHNPCELFIDFNLETMDIWDVTDKSAPLMLSSTDYPNAFYAHSGWWSEDKRFIFLQDELDEQDAGVNTTMWVFDIANLTAPKNVGKWTGDKRCIDHNSFVVGTRLYMSTYRCGLTVLDVTDPKSPLEVGFFDTFISMRKNTAEFHGSWGVYPFLPSGSLLVSNIEDGLFVLRESKQPLPQ